MTFETLVSLATLFVSVITIATIIFRVGRQFQRLEDRMARLEERLSNLEARLEERIARVEGNLTHLSQQFEQRISRLEERIVGLETNLTRRMDNLYTWAEGFSREVNAFFGIIIQLLSNRKQLTTEELALVTQGLSALNTPAVVTLFQRERISRNPLTPEELDRLEGYYRRLQGGNLLTWEEVQDYNQLVAVLQKERPTDPGVWPLAALGAFLHGLMLGRSERR